MTTLTVAPPPLAMRPTTVLPHYEDDDNPMAGEQPRWLEPIGPIGVSLVGFDGDQVVALDDPLEGVRSLLFNAEYQYVRNLPMTAEVAESLGG